MFRTARSRANGPLIDLETVRETLLYMRDDMRRDPATSGVARALDEAINEIARIEMDEPTPRRTAFSRFLARPV